MENVLSYQELIVMRRIGRVASKTLRQLKKIIRPGISTKEIEIFFERILAKHDGMEAAFRGYQNYPASLCVSVNEEIIHGLPSKDKIIKEGDLISVDLGIRYKGFFIDAAYTYTVGKVPSLGKRLVKAGKVALREAIKKARIGARVGDISATIQGLAQKYGFSVIRNFVGHGIGRSLHCPPEIPNFGQEHTGDMLVEGEVIAIEPMVCSGSYEIKILDDGWTAKTKDNSLSCHFEHTVAVTKRGPWILTK
jgi:methionyl aminopeptidase